MPRLRRSTLAVSAAIALAACSSTPADVEPASTDPVTTMPADDSAPASERSGSVADDVAATGELPAWTVAIDVVAEGFEGGGIDATVDWAGDPDTPTARGPFGRFGSCSGLGEHVGAYTVFVSGSEVADHVGIWTADPVSGAGTYDAEVRVERVGLPPLVASGTITLADGLQAGEFAAFGPQGGSVEGSFRCSGSDPASPLGGGGAEVVALLRDGDAERVVTLAADTGDGMACPNVPGSTTGDPVIRVEGDTRLGAITAFELAANPSSARLRVGGVDYEFVDVVTSIDPTGASGAFSGTSVDGTSVDGAFRCA